MKTSVILALCSGLLGSSLALAQPAAPPAWEPLKIVDQPPPIYPHDLIQMGVHEGFTRIAFSVDADGKISDCLVVAYTHRPFADAAMAAMRHWRFAPAKVNGVPVAVNTTVNIDYRVEGTPVVSLNGSEHVVTLFFRLPTNRDAYRPAQAGELDRLPVVKEGPSPVYPQELAATRAGEVKVEFYIDESGTPRMPGVSPNEDPELAALAVDALSQWKFEPATAKGRPVMVRAAQVFAFGGARALPAQ